MKKIKITMSLLMLAFSVTAFSQVHLGAKAGANLGKLDGVAYKDNFELGYQVGGFVSVGLGKLAVQGEVLFNQTNTTFKDSYTSVWNNAFDKGKTLNYVSVPVLLKYNPEGRVSLMAGPQFSFLTNRDENLWQNGEKLFKETDFSVVAGAELNFKPLSVYARYVWGFSDISNFGNEKANSQQIQVGLALQLF
ncbi:MAG: porin family protein [Capnocytophaga sp.]|nr:porin family protein [Capnocytophaga sp.]